MLFPRQKTFILDIDTLADPRVVQFLSLGLVNGRLILPQPTHAELDYVVQRAKENLNRVKQIPGLKVKLCPEIKTVEDMLRLAKKYRATIITIRPEVKAAADGLPVITTREICELFRPSYLPGTVIRVKVSKRGKERNEGIGYLEGGIKVVVENGGNAVGQEVEVVIQGGIDTEVGQVLFAKLRFEEVH
ncbi:MAG: TRAM domain-containing protein [candidate division WOR-3 bacterium]